MRFLGDFETPLKSEFTARAQNSRLYSAINLLKAEPDIFSGEIK